MHLELMHEQTWYSGATYYYVAPTFVCIQIRVLLCKAQLQLLTYRCETDIGYGNETAMASMITAVTVHCLRSQSSFQ